MAKPNTKLPKQTVMIYCKTCKAKLLKYHKLGKGALIKCFIQRIAKDYTVKAMECPKCNQVFAKHAIIKGLPAYKISAAQVIVK